MSSHVVEPATLVTCLCGHDSREHACGTGRCWTQGCRCVGHSVPPRVVPRGTKDRCARCGTTHAMPEVPLPWCPVEGRKARVS